MLQWPDVSVQDLQQVWKVAILEVYRVMLGTAEGVWEAKVTLSLLLASSNPGTNQGLL